MDVDTRLKKLAEVIDSYPGIQTIMSCGGHKEYSRVPENEFYITFGLKTKYPTEKAWQSINVIAQLITSDSMYEREGSHPDTWIKMEVCKDEDSTIFFQLHGRNVDPEVVSEILVNSKLPLEYIKPLNPKIPLDKLKFSRITGDILAIVLLIILLIIVVWLFFFGGLHSLAHFFYDNLRIWHLFRYEG
jgi:hypothetical protein